MKLIKKTLKQIKSKIRETNKAKQRQIGRKKYGSNLLGLLYPPRCPVCHDIIEPGYEMICGKCVEKLPVIQEPCCKKCGKPVKNEPYCHDCRERIHEFEAGTAVFLYDDIMRKSISYFKYKGRQEYGTFYGKTAWKYRGEILKRWNIEAVIPVPVHISRRVKRGYNQAEIIARVLAEEMKLPVSSDAVVRVGKTIAQKELSPEERQKNLEHAFLVKNPLPWKRVLLVDDIYTTGSTADAVCRAIKRQGNCEIYVLSICIGKGFMVQ